MEDVDSVSRAVAASIRRRTNAVRGISWEARRVRIALGNEMNGPSSVARDADR